MNWLPEAVVSKLPQLWRLRATEMYSYLELEAMHEGVRRVLLVPAGVLAASFSLVDAAISRLKLHCFNLRL